MHFAFFDPEAGIGFSRRNLPHWFQSGACYFVTFRTADSLPAEVIARWSGERQKWLAANGIDADDPNWALAVARLPKPQQDEFHRSFTDAFHDLLDAGHGECVLRRSDSARVVADAFKHFDGQRYHLSDFVVMPSHVHLLFSLIGDTALADVCYSWKKFTATRINQLLRRRGHFWQGESFDHIVRSGEQFEYLRDYVAKNPAKAGLKAGDFVLYRSGE